MCLAFTSQQGAILLLAHHTDIEPSSPYGSGGGVEEQIKAFFMSAIISSHLRAIVRKVARSEIKGEGKGDENVCLEFSLENSHF